MNIPVPLISIIKEPSRTLNHSIFSVSFRSYFPHCHYSPRVLCRLDVFVVSLLGAFLFHSQLLECHTVQCLFNSGVFPGGFHTLTDIHHVDITAMGAVRCLTEGEDFQSLPEPASHITLWKPLGLFAYTVPPGDRSWIITVLVCFQGDQASSNQYNNESTLLGKSLGSHTSFLPKCQGQNKVSFS